MSNEDLIHQMYANIQQQREEMERRTLQAAETNNSNTFFGRQPYYSAAPRANEPSFRSQFFNVGEGLISVSPNETVVLAQKTVPSQHAGVLTGFSQYFGDCDSDSSLENQVLWGLRINGLPLHGFMDFIGIYSSLMLPHSIYFPLAGGAATLGTVDASVGGSSLENIPTVTFQATNYYSTPIVLQGRLIGYTFPTAERNDQFSNI